MQIYVKWSNSYVHHLNYCQWRIPIEVAAEYSKQVFLNTHH